MNRTSILALCALASLGALLGTAWYLLESAPGPERSANHFADTKSATLEASSATPQMSSEPPGPTTSASSVETDEDSGASPRRVAAGTASASELEEAHWVAGRVLFPTGTPATEELFVVANGRDFADGSDHEVRVSNDGRFRVAFSKKTRIGYLQIRARFLYLEQRIKLKPRSLAGEEFLLEPTLGGVLRGSVLAPEGSLDEDIVGAAVTCRNSSFPPQSIQRTTEVLRDRTFEYLGLPPGEGYRLSLDPGAFAIATESDLAVTAGGVTTIDLTLGQALRLFGSVVDANGEAVSAGRVRARTTRVPRTSYTRPRRTTTLAADGTFELEGVTPGEIVLTITSKGFLEREVDLGRRMAGSASEELRITLERGASLRGRVVWEGGDAAADANVVATASTGRDFNPNAPSAKTDANGFFEIQGLEERTYRIQSHARRRVPAETAAEGSADSATAGKPWRRRGKRVTWRATLDGVEAGTDDVLLTLSLGTRVTGRVTDQNGAPIEAFRVSWIRAENRADSLFSASRRFASPSGEFELQLEPGNWSLAAEAADFAEVRIELSVPPPGPSPARLAPVLFALPRPERLAGIVRAPNGAAVPGARVTVQTQDDALFAISLDGGDEMHAETDVYGRFEFSNAPLEPFFLRATADGFAPSEKLSLEAGDAGSLPPIELQLLTGGSIAGIVYDLHGSPAPARRVSVFGVSGSSGRARTLADGTFDFQHLTPGRYTVSVPGSDAEYATLDNFDGDNDILARSERVNVRDGETVQVVFRPKQLELAQLHGNLRRDDAPIDDARLYLSLKPAHGKSTARTTSNASGDYAATVTLAGTYRANFSLPGGNVSLHTEVDLAASVERQLDLDFATGTLSGRVESAGVALAGVTVQATSKRLDVAMDSARSRTTSGDDGRFELRGLPTGRWDVMAGGSRTPYQPGTLKDIALSARASVENLTFDLSPSATVHGLVTHANGRPAANVQVSVHSALSRFLSSNSSPLAQKLGSPNSDTTNADGGFALTNLEPGKTVLEASSELQLSPTSVEVLLEPGDENFVRIVLPE